MDGEKCVIDCRVFVIQKKRSIVSKLIYNKLYLRNVMRYASSVIQKK